jgi:hypothetical protein
MSTSSKVAWQPIQSLNSKNLKVRKPMSIKYRFKRWLRNWINQEENLVAAEKPTRLVESTDIDSNQPMRITIHRAAGGMVIETRTYDRIKDRSNQNLHIVTHEQDLAEGLSKIITMESLRA